MHKKFKIVLHFNKSLTWELKIIVIRVIPKQVNCLLILILPKFSPIW